MDVYKDTLYDINPEFGCIYLVQFIFDEVFQPEYIDFKSTFFEISSRIPYHYLLKVIMGVSERVHKKID